MGFVKSFIGSFAVFMVIAAVLLYIKHGRR